MKPILDTLYYFVDQKYRYKKQLKSVEDYRLLGMVGIVYLIEFLRICPICDK